jgi:hypothetical protein
MANLSKFCRYCARHNLGSYLEYDTVPARPTLIGFTVKVPR